MNGLMLQKQLLISSLIMHADRHHGDTEIVSRRVEGDIHRYTFRDCHRRARQVASALTDLGVKMSERIGTLAWNGYRHMELYYGICGMGAVMHTINPRLHEDQVAYIVDHAEDQYLFFDLTFLPLVKVIAERCKTVKAFIAMTDREHMPPDSGIANLLCYEDLIEGIRPPTGGPTSTRIAPPPCATHQARQGNPQGAFCTPIAPSLLHSYDCSAAGCTELFGARRGSSSGADVPCQCMGHPVRCMHGRRQAGLPGPRAKGRQILCTSSWKPSR